MLGQGDMQLTLLYTDACPGMFAYKTISNPPIHTDKPTVNATPLVQGLESVE
jgi:hypothetical protein